jgi:glyoxylase-like metal-dependent hydrolase (beta-lactamase superfamily II)
LEIRLSVGGIMAEVDVLLRGFPGVSSRGYFGWCNVVLIRSGGEILLFDTGSHGDRALLLKELEGRGLGPRDIDLVVISHLHFDHCLNADLFKGARLLISEEDVGYACSDRPDAAGDTFVPRAHAERLAELAEPLRDGDRITGEVEAMALPGHTPGLMGLFLRGEGIVLASDSVKNAWEFARMDPTACFHGKGDAIESMRRIAGVAKVVIPGHDRPFEIQGGRIKYRGGIKVEISAMLAPELEGPIRYSISAGPEP